MEFLYWAIGYVCVGFIVATLVHVFTEFYASVEYAHEKRMVALATIFYPIALLSGVVYFLTLAVAYVGNTAFLLSKRWADYLRNKYRVKNFNRKNAKAWKGKV